MLDLLDTRERRHKTRRCRRVTYPESYIIKYRTYTKMFFPNAGSTRRILRCSFQAQAPQIDGRDIPAPSLDEFGRRIPSHGKFFDLAYRPPPPLHQIASAFPTPYTLHPGPFTLHPAPYTYTLPTPYTLHPASYTYTLPTPYTLHPTLYNTLHRTVAFRFEKQNPLNICRRHRKE